MATDQTSTPTISRVLANRTLVELVYDAGTRQTSLAICEVSGETRIADSLELASGERLIPLSPKNSLIEHDAVLLPSAIGAFSNKNELLDAIRDFIHRYVDLAPTFEEIAAHYVLLTWVYDAFGDLSYLRFRGDFGTGKTRALLTIGSLCYKPFFASGASTVSPIFHIQDAFQGTLILDEADFRFSDATAQLAKVLNNGTTSGMPVLRTMANRNRELSPQAFRVFGPKLIGMREHFTDQALESRFITSETNGRALRADVPIQLPTSFKEEARTLRNSLLAWRFFSRFSISPDPSRVPEGLAPRYRQSSLALLSLVDDPTLRADIVRELAGEEARVLQERAESLEAAMLAAIIAAFELSDGPHASIARVTERFNAATKEDLGRGMTNKWVGGFVRTRLRLRTTKTSGVYVIPASERSRALAVAARYGLSGV
jgi:hypothetical protein